MKLIDSSIKEFVQLLSSDAPAPGGGSAAALSGALGAALTHMVCGLTLGKAKYAAQQPLIESISEDVAELQQQLLVCIDSDTQAFHAVSQAFSLPKQSDTEKEQRTQAIQKALQGCTLPPLEIMQYAVKALRLTQRALGNSNSNASSDLGVAALTLKAALQGAWLNVLINLGSIKDEAFVAQHKQYGLALLREAESLADDIYGKIVTQFI